VKTLSNRTRASFPRGLSMIEVLVAIVIISLGLLGMAGLQASSLRGSQSAVYRGQAVQFAADMAERMRGNLGDARNYAIAIGDPVPSGTSVTDMDRADWLARLATLPGGAGAIGVDTVNNVVSITVQWDDSRAGGNPLAQYTLVTRVWNN
jgi:type IV pilus assembly protein PilV